MDPGVNRSGIVTSYVRAGYALLEMNHLAEAETSERTRATFQFEPRGGP
jgi:hypothetical protein